MLEFLKERESMAFCCEKVSSTLEPLLSFAKALHKNPCIHIYTYVFVLVGTHVYTCIMGML